MHRHFFGLSPVTAPEPVWEPPANVVASDGDILIDIALPGADLGSIGVEVLAGAIQVEVRVPPPRFAPRASIVRLEIPYGIMRRRINLPGGRYRLSERRIGNGCLHLRLTESQR